MVPRKLPPKAVAGEKRIHAILKKLPDDCVVYYEPDVGGLRPDFVVILPCLGVLIIEVKGWTAKQLIRADCERVVLNRNGREETFKHPIKQARDYMFQLMDIARANHWAHHLIHSSGLHVGRFRFPFSYCAALTNIRDSLNVESSDRSAWNEVFPPSRTILREEVMDWETLSGETLHEALSAYVQPSWDIVRLNLDEVNVLRAIIHPIIEFDCIVSLKGMDAAAQPVNEQPDVINVLDKKQESLALSIGEGHRIVYGVAGSGKTLLLLARARKLALQNPDTRILFVCYNRALAGWLRGQLVNQPQVVVLHLHGWASRNGVQWKFRENNRGFGERLLSALRNGSHDSRFFDAILVDEAQDFEPNWFQCLLAAMQDPEDGDLMIVADGCQSLYQRSAVRWCDLGIKAVGRTVSKRFHLDQNYRNSSEIIALAETFAHAGGETPDDVESIQSERIRVGSCMRSTGIRPMLFRQGNRSAEIEYAISLVAGLIKGQWDGRKIVPLRPDEIGVFYPGVTSDEEKTLLDEMIRTMMPICPAVWLTRNSNAKDLVQNRCLKLQTIHSAKGLQYRAVIVIWADQLPWAPRDAARVLEDRRLMYVAMTRAVSFLAITAAANSAFITEIAQSPALKEGQASRSFTAEKPVKLSLPS